MINNLKVFLLLLCVTLSLLCKKTSNTCHWYTPPNTLIFQMKHNGQAIADTILQKVKLRYGNDNYLSDFSIATDTNYSNMGFMGTRNIGLLSGEQNIKTYFLEFPDNNIDTLFIDYSSETPSTNCQYLLRKVEFNNQVPSIDVSFKFSSPVYVLNKP